MYRKLERAVANNDIKQVQHFISKGKDVDHVYTKVKKCFDDYNYKEQYTLLNVCKTYEMLALILKHCNLKLDIYKDILLYFYNNYHATRLLLLEQNVQVPYNLLHLTSDYKTAKLIIQLSNINIHSTVNNLSVLEYMCWNDLRTYISEDNFNNMANFYIENNVRFDKSNIFKAMKSSIIYGPATFNRIKKIEKLIAGL